MRTVGVTAGASAPEFAVEHLLGVLAKHGFDELGQVVATEEKTSFELPAGLRRRE